MSKTDLSQMIAEKMATPMVLKMLKPYNGAQMCQAIMENIDLSKILQSNPEELGNLKTVVRYIPYSDKVAKEVRSRRWIKWFLEGPLKKERPDLYAQIVYNGGFNYVVRQIQRITNLVFS